VLASLKHPIAQKLLAKKFLNIVPPMQKLYAGFRLFCQLAILPNDKIVFYRSGASFV
jgi:hypothetical protein